MEMEFVNDLTGERVWGEVLYDSSNGRQWSWEDSLAIEAVWLAKPVSEAEKRDLWKAANGLFLRDLLEVVERGDEPIGFSGPVLREA